MDTHTEGHEAGTTQAVCDFGFALTNVRIGSKLSRRVWANTGKFIELQTPDVNSKMTSEYLYLNELEGIRTPFIASNSDLLACDWFIVE